MPTWFRCKECFSKYYTAAPLEEAMIDDECEKCKNQIEPIYYEIGRFLKSNLEVDFNIKKKNPARLNKAKIMAFNNNSINLFLFNNTYADKFFDFRVSCRVSFARDEYPAGRFYFDSEILNYNKDKSLGVIISTPEYLVRKQERSAPRYSLRTAVKYRLADDINNLLANDHSDYKQGWTIDISKSGLLLMADSEAPEEINNDKYVDLMIEYDSYNISTIGNVARVNNNDNDNSIALGIKFLEQKSANLDLIEELGERRIVH